MTAWTRKRFEDLHAQYAVPDAALTDKKEQKGRRILRAATDLFVRLGYRKTSIDDIARAAGVGKGTVYLYFETKADLLMHCIVLEKAEPGMRLMAEMATMRVPAQILHYTLRNAFAMAHDMPLLSRLTQGDHELNLVLDEMGVETKNFLRSSQIEHFRMLLGPVATVSDAALDQVALALLTLVRATFAIADEVDPVGMDRETHADIMGDILTAGVLHAVGAQLDAAPRDDDAPANDGPASAPRPFGDDAPANDGPDDEDDA